jgi:hypothetical protein
MSYDSKQIIIMNDPKTEENTYFNKLPKEIRLAYFQKYNSEDLNDTPPECMLFRVAVLLLDIVIDDTLMTDIVSEFIKCMANEKSFIDTFRSYPGVFSVHSPHRKDEEITRLIRFCDLMNAKLTDDNNKKTYKRQIQTFVSSCSLKYKDTILKGGDTNTILQNVLNELQYKERVSDSSAYIPAYSAREPSRLPSPLFQHLPTKPSKSKSKISPVIVKKTQNKKPCRYGRKCHNINDPGHAYFFDHSQDNTGDNHHRHHHYPPDSRRGRGGRKPQTIIKKRYTRRRRQTCKRSSRRRCRY